MMGRCNCQAAMNQESLYYGGVGVGTARNKDHPIAKSCMLGQDGQALNHCLTQSLAGGSPQSRAESSALNLRRTQKASTAGGCQLTIPVLSSCPALGGICISLPRPHPHLLGLLPVHADDFLVEMPVRSHCRISPTCLTSVHSSPEGLAPEQPLADEERIGEEYNPLSSLLQWDISAHMFYTTFREVPRRTTSLRCLHR